MFPAQQDACLEVHAQFCSAAVSGALFTLPWRDPGVGGGLIAAAAAAAVCDLHRFSDGV